jgi:hypothetical protein
MIPDLKQRIDEFQQKQMIPHIPPAMLESLFGGIEELVRMNLERSALRVGDRAPDFELPNAVGSPVRLSSLLERGPAVVTFYRGGW